MGLLSWLYHGRDEKQCFYEPCCLVCFVRLGFFILRERWRDVHGS